jgi:RimJ/RimL family protein N-acetyltransferase
LFDAYGEDTEGRNWTYMGYGPFASLTEFEAWLAEICRADDPLFHAVVEAESGRALGLASYLRVQAEIGVIEVGNINYAPALQRRAAATEAMYLMMQRVFEELGYRRYEWKCDALNDASRRAAERLGFVFEGVFRQATLYKGRNRDTAWYAILDRDWPALKRAYEAWLDPANLDAAGAQKARLAEFMGRA